MKRCTVIVVMVAMLLLAGATPADACRGLFRRGLFRCSRARVARVQQLADKADAVPTNGQPPGILGTIPPKPATDADVAPEVDEDVIDVVPDVDVGVIDVVPVPDVESEHDN